MRDSSAYTRLLAVRDMRLSNEERREADRLRRLTVDESLARARARAEERRQRVGRAAMPKGLSAALAVDAPRAGSRREPDARPEPAAAKTKRGSQLPYKD